MDLSRQNNPDSSETLPVTTAGVVVHVCETCRAADQAPEAPRAGATLVQSTKALATPDVEIRSVTCLANCKRGLSAAIQSRDGWTYVFGDLTLESAQDLLEGARLLGTSTDGLMPWKGRPDSLKRGMIARVPPLLSIPSDHQKP